MTQLQYSRLPSVLVHGHLLPLTCSKGLAKEGAKEGDREGAERRVPSRGMNSSFRVWRPSTSCSRRSPIWGGGDISVSKVWHRKHIRWSCRYRLHPRAVHPRAQRGGARRGRHKRGIGATGVALRFAGVRARGGVVSEEHEQPQRIDRTHKTIPPPHAHVYIRAWQTPRAHAPFAAADATYVGGGGRRYPRLSRWPVRPKHQHYRLQRVRCGLLLS